MLHAFNDRLSTVMLESWTKCANVCFTSLVRASAMLLSLWHIKNQNFGAASDGKESKPKYVLKHDVPRSTGFIQFKMWLVNRILLPE
jgi:hypothetical protein